MQIVEKDEDWATAVDGENHNGVVSALTDGRGFSAILPFLVTTALALVACSLLGQLGPVGASTLRLPLPAAWLGGELLIPSGWFIVLWLVLFILSLLGVLFFPRGLSFRRASIVIGTVALSARILMLPMPHSDDVNRYLWEGRILSAGFSPYSHAARPAAGERQDDTALEALRDPDDPYWRGVNHPHMTAIYPPFMLLLMAGISWVSYSAAAIKGTMLLLDLATLAVLLALVRLVVFNRL